MCVLLYLDIKKPTDICVSPVGVIFFDIEKEQIEYINLLSIYHDNSTVLLEIQAKTIKSISKQLMIGCLESNSAGCAKRFCLMQDLFMPF